LVKAPRLSSRIESPMKKRGSLIGCDNNGNSVGLEPLKEAKEFFEDDGRDILRMTSKIKNVQTGKTEEITDEEKANSIKAENIKQRLKMVQKGGEIMLVPQIESFTITIGKDGVEEKKVKK